jgi:hypothetical protein
MDDYHLVVENLVDHLFLVHLIPNATRRHPRSVTSCWP